MAAGVAAVALVSLGACGGASFDGRRFEKDLTAYQVGPLPAPWRRVKVDDQDLAFRDASQGTIGVHALCQDYDDVPHAALLNHLLFGFTQRSYQVEEDVVLDGRTARHAIIDAELDGAPVRLEIYLLTRNGCVFDLSYVSSRSAPARGVFTAFVQGFAIERAGG